jgi:hypothetical protein
MVHSCYNGDGLGMKDLCWSVPLAQAAGGVAGQALGPEIYGGGRDWTGILAANGAGLLVGLVVNYLVMKGKVAFLMTGSKVHRGYYKDNSGGSRSYCIGGYAHSSGFSMGYDQGLQLLTSMIVLAALKHNSRDFLYDLGMLSTGQALLGTGMSTLIAKQIPKDTRIAAQNLKFNASNKAFDVAVAAQGGPVAATMS